MLFFMLFKKIHTYAYLLRVHQWYKNLFVFLPALFQRTDIYDVLYYMTFAFVGFCFASSITYIINDWVDRERDRLHPVKKNRPLASGAVSGRAAFATILVLSVIELMIMYALGWFYTCVILIYVVLTNAYSYYLKHIPPLDILLIAANFMLRVSAGLVPALAPWYVHRYLLILLFSMIIIFTTSKRRADQKLLGADAVAHKPALAFYTKRRSDMIRWIGTVGVAVGIYGLHIVGVPQTVTVSTALFIGFTLYIFHTAPRVVLSPHRLFVLWYWDVMFVLWIATIVLWQVEFRFLFKYSLSPFFLW